MNTAALLALLGDLYGQIAALQEENARLRAAQQDQEQEPQAGSSTT